MSKFGDIWIDHKEKIELYWNKFVTEDDVVLIPGDISWGNNFEQAENDLNFVHSLPGTKIISPGNHDWWLKSYESVKNLLTEDIILVNGRNPLYFKGLLIGAEKGSLVPGDKYYVETKHQNSYEKNTEKVKNALITLREYKESLEVQVVKTIFMLHYPPNTFYGKVNEYGDYVVDSKIVDICVYGHIHSPEEWSNALQNIYKGVEFVLGSGDYLNFVPKHILTV